MRLAFGISLTLNLLLAVAFAHRLSPAGAKGHSPHTKHQRPVAASAGTNQPAAPPFNWFDVEAEDYKDYIENLRRIGCPERTVCDIITADVAKLYARRMAPLRQVVPGENYWIGGPIWTETTPSLENQRALRQLEKEKRAVLRDLLGEACVAGSNSHPRLGNDSFILSLPETTRDQLEEVMLEFDRNVREVHRRAGGMLLEADHAEITRLRNERTDAIRRLLDPHQLFEFELRHSETADSIRRNDLKVFDATEEEFRTLFRIRRAQEMAKLSPDRTQLILLQAQEEEVLRQSFGQQRYEEFMLAQNWEYQTLLELGMEQHVPQGTAKEIIDLKSDVERRVAAIQNDGSLGHDEKSKAVRTIRTETEQRLIQMLGEAI